MTEKKLCLPIFLIFLLFFFCRAKFEYISRRNVLVLSLNVSLCFDEESCEIDAVIFKDTELLLQTCDFDKQFPVAGT